MSVRALDKPAEIVYSRDMSTTSNTRPAFRKPWTFGAKAYHEADTLPALAEGFKRARKLQYVHMPLQGLKGGVDKLPCACCGVALGDKYAVNPGEEPSVVDNYATVQYDPRTKRAALMHYYCSWGVTMNRILQLGRALGI